MVRVMKVLIYDSGLGLISVVREIIKQKKENDYYLFIDKEYFPFGRKKPIQLKNRLEYLFSIWKKEDYEMIIIACNTMSLIYRKYFKRDDKVICIGDYTLNHLDDDSLILATSTFSKLANRNHKIKATILAEYIENKNIRKIISTIKKMHFSKKNIILGCTHYPLIKPIFEKYHKKNKFMSYENELVKKIKDDGHMSFTSNIELDDFFIS